MMPQTSNPLRRESPTRLFFRAWFTALFLVVGVVAAPASVAISWHSTANATNLDSTGALMGGGFVFELGVFAGAFVPTAANQTEWEEHWHAAQQTVYNESTKRYASVFNASSNTPPFTASKAAWVWGRKGGAGSEEWILFRAPSWTWPNTGMPGPSLNPWEAKDATIVVAGAINASGTPFLMQSEAVASGLDYDTWRAAKLAGEPLDAPGDDPDGDGMTNLEEFVFGSDPLVPGGRPDFEQGWFETGGETFRTLRIPRLADRLAEIEVQVSEDLVAWLGGDENGEVVEILEDEAGFLLVRDLEPVSSHPTRFYRLRISLPGEDG